MAAWTPLALAKLMGRAAKNTLAAPLNIFKHDTPVLAPGPTTLGAPAPPPTTAFAMSTGIVAANAAAAKARKKAAGGSVLGTPVAGTPGIDLARGTVKTLLGGGSYQTKNQ